MEDSRFMTAAQKESVLRAWERFLKGAMKPEHFTTALYEHLIQHCGFIAHYNRRGFYGHYFTSGDGKAAFLSQFDARGAGTDGIPRSVELGMTYWCSGDYEDINREMIAVAGRHIPMLLLEAEAQQKDSDLAAARALLAKHGYKLDLTSQ